MNRKEAITVAVLINAALMIIVFAMGLKSEENVVAVVTQEEASKPQNVSIPLLAAPKGGDEVDQVLKQFSKEKLLPEPIVVLPAEKTPALQILEEKSLPSLTTLVKDQEAAALLPPLNGQKVVVKKGDALEKIAKRHNVSVAALMKENKLSDPRLKIGQVLIIPKSQTEPGSSEKTQKTEETKEKYYTVKPGDNPWTIAVKNHMKVEELLSLNGLNPEKARHLKPGDQLRIK